MNKELILKYKTEFDHWLNGGKLRHKAYGKWEQTNNIWSYRTSDIAAVIIDDQYAEFRKALAEGKTVQKQDYYSRQWIDMKTANFHGASDTHYEGVYRIKPEETI